MTVQCITAVHGNHSAAACALPPDFALSNFCDDTKLTSAQGICWGSAILATVVLFFYVRETRARMRAVEVRVTSRRSWRRSNSMPSDEAKVCSRPLNRGHVSPIEP